MTWIVLALFCVAVLVTVYACCRMSGMSDEEVEMYAEEQARRTMSTYSSAGLRSRNNSNRKGENVDKEKLTAILDSHNKWLNDEDGKCADLSGANLSSADLLNADLSGADLSDADLSDANLRGADLSSANLIGADLSGASLSCADLSGANLRGAELSGANLRGADLSGADLSDAKGIKTASEFLAKLETDEFGYVVYKKIGDTYYDAPKHWTITPGSFLTEVVNPIPTVDCACGVNFGTREWCDKNYKDADLWRCRIRFEDLADVVIPYHSDGKARCARLELIEKL